MSILGEVETTDQVVLEKVVLRHLLFANAFQFSSRAGIRIIGARALSNEERILLGSCAV